MTQTMIPVLWQVPPQPSPHGDWNKRYQAAELPFSVAHISIGDGLCFPRGDSYFQECEQRGIAPRWERPE